MQNEDAVDRLVDTLYLDWNQITFDFVTCIKKFIKDDSLWIEYEQNGTYPGKYHAQTKRWISRYVSNIYGKMKDRECETGVFVEYPRPGGISLEEWEDPSLLLKREAIVTR